MINTFTYCAKHFKVSQNSQVCTCDLEQLGFLWCLQFFPGYLSGGLGSGGGLSLGCSSGINHVWRICCWACSAWICALFGISLLLLVTISIAVSLSGWSWVWFLSGFVVVFLFVVLYLCCSPGPVYKSVHEIIPGQVHLVLTCLSQHGWWVNL